MLGDKTAEELRAEYIGETVCLKIDELKSRWAKGKVLFVEEHPESKRITLVIKVNDLEGLINGHYKTAHKCEADSPLPSDKMEQKDYGH